MKKLLAVLLILLTLGCHKTISPQPTPLTSYTLEFGVGTTAFTTFQIETSPDQINWTTVKSIVGSNMSGGDYVVDLALNQQDWVRVASIEPNNQVTYSITLQAK